MAKIILDTNIYISALIFSDLFKDKVLKIINNHHIIISKNILNELENKLENKFNVSKKVLSILKNDPVINICRDKKDNYLLLLAQFTKADYLITGDKDLLILKKYKKTKIVAINDFLNN